MYRILGYLGIHEISRLLMNCVGLRKYIDSYRAPLIYLHDARIDLGYHG